MKIRTSIQSRKRRTKTLVKEYGNQLTSVRYRYYFDNNKFKNIELIIKKDNWSPHHYIHNNCM